MNFSLLDSIADIENGVLATVLRTDGHTYKKKGDKALFGVDDPIPRYGNLGSSCAGQDLVEAAAQAYSQRRPRVESFDMSDEGDIHFGYGAFCGGSMDILLEPLFDDQRRVYAHVRRQLEARTAGYLVHDLSSGDLEFTTSPVTEVDGILVEPLVPLQRLFIFGATPLSARILAAIDDMPFEMHVMDWRSHYLDTLAAPSSTRRHLDDYPLAHGDYLLVLSHHFERDLGVIAQALSAGCVYIGVLSSTTRRDALLDHLRTDGVAGDLLSRIRCPVGLDIHARTDAEIAVSIAAELIKVRHS